MKVALKKIWAWLVYSSKDSNNISLTVKMILTYGVTTLTMIAGFAHFQIPGNDQFSAIIDSIVSLVQITLLWVSTIVGIAAGIRKIWLSFSGTNSVVNDVIPTITG